MSNCTPSIPDLTVMTDHYPDSEPQTSSLPTPPPTSSPFFIRPATQEDVQAIVNIGRKTWRVTFEHSTTPENIAAYLDSAYIPKIISEAIANPNLLYLVACNSTTGEIAGFVVLARDSSTSEPCVTDWPRPIELQRVYVDAQYHGAGLAKQMANEAYNTARKEGYESIWLGVLPANARAVRFYEKSGFKKVGTHEFIVGDQRDVDDIMIRLL